MIPKLKVKRLKFKKQNSELKIKKFQKLINLYSGAFQNANCDSKLKILKNC